MSDDTVQVPDVPQNPPAPDGAGGIPQALETPPTSETPQSAPDATVDPPPSQDGDDDSQGQEGGSEGQQEAQASVPVVEMLANSQTVTMPDGSVVTTRTHPYPISNKEWMEYERTHSGDQERYPWKPGDAQYSANADPSVPDSHAAQRVEREIQSYADRVKNEPGASISPMWDAFQPVYQGALEQAIKTGGGNSEVEA